MSVIGFPTQGEVLQFVFNVLGVLPRKHERDESFEEAKKKTTQAALRRLANEDGHLEPSLGNLLTTLSYLTAGALPSRASFAFREAFFDLFETYQDALRTEGSCLSKIESIRYLLLDRGAPRLAISIAKQLQRYNVIADNLLVPDDKYWYMPTLDGQKWHWPLEKVMLWAYELAGTSAAKFHCPDADAESSLLSKNYDSARNWLKGDHLPSWSSLNKNYIESFAAVNRQRAREGTPLLSDHLVASVCTALFLSRAVTAATRSIYDHCGTETLVEFCTRFRLVFESTTDARDTIQENVWDYIDRKNLTEAEWDEAWFRVTTDYWRWFVEWQDKLRHFAATGALNHGQVLSASRKLGRLSLLEFERPDAFAPTRVSPSGFGELLMEGIALQEAGDLSIEKIEAYAIKLESSGLSQTLPWMTSWLYSTRYYRKTEYEKAYPYAKEALDSAQYCAGVHQSLLLNQFIDLAAKNDKWKEFRKAIHWAEYLGIEIRGFDKSTSTGDGLKTTFEIIKRIHYRN